MDRTHPHTLALSHLSLAVAGRAEPRSARSLPRSVRRLPLPEELKAVRERKGKGVKKGVEGVLFCGRFVNVSAPVGLGARWSSKRPLFCL